MVARNGARADALALRFAGGLMLVGGVLLLLVALGLRLLPYDAGADGYALPGGDRRIAAVAPLLLAGSGGLLALIGGAAMLAGGSAITPGVLRRFPARRLRAALILCAGLAALLLALARR